MHLLRRNLPMIYVIENNGVYGLTKGQFSATADLGSTLKTGRPTTCRRSIAARWRCVGRHLRRPVVQRR
jgi:pyruvate/2-oxoacid:ferredoxin oxidoreductase beta subunit